MPAANLPRPVLRVALEKGPNDTVLEADWTDLSDRIKTISSTRGRRSARDDFGPGTLTVELDNYDRQLDPSNPSGLVYTADLKGLPMCPVELDLVWGGNTYRRFTGYLGSDCWQHAVGRGRRADTVVLQAQDLLAYPPDLPAYPWASLLTQLANVDQDYSWWYLPMEPSFPTLEDGSEVANRSGSGGVATLQTGSAGIQGQIIRGDAPSTETTLRIYSGELVSPASGVMPDGDELNMTIALFWRPDTTALGTGEVKQIVRMEEPGGGIVRWKIQVEDDGKVHIYSYDSGGSLIGSEEIAGTDWSIYNSWHLVIVRFESGNNMDVWVGGFQAPTVTATAAVYESDLIVGPSVSVFDVDEVAVIRRALTDAEIDGMNLAYGYSAMWFGFTHADTMGAFFQAARRKIGFDETNEWHLPSTPADDYGFWGLGAIPSPPDNLVAAGRTVAGPFGAVWATKEGNLRVRTIDALTDATYAANYATVSANFTDADDTLTPPDYRHAGATMTGAQLDRVINEASCTFYYLTAPPDRDSATTLTVTARDQDSIDRLGLHRESDTTIAWHGWLRASTFVDTMIERYAWPIDEVQQLELDATGDDDLTDWLAGTCELELAVTFSYVPPGGDEGDRVTLEDLNIQQESWTLDVNKTFKATLVVAKS